MNDEQRDSLPAVESKQAQVAECASCGRVAVVLCGNCIRPAGTRSNPVRLYTSDQVEEAVLKWCGFPAQTIENVRHALAMEATEGIDRTNQETPPT